MATGTRGSGLNFTARLDTAEAKKSVAELKRMMSELQQSFPNVTAASINTEPLTNYQQANNALRTSLLEAQVEAQRLRNEMLSLNASYRQGQISAQQLSAAERQARMERRQLAEASRNARQSQVAANGSYREAQQQLARLGNTIRSVEGGFANTSRLQRARIAQYNQLNSAIKRFDASMVNGQRKIVDFRGLTASAVGQLQSMLTVQTAITAATEAYKTFLSLDKTKASLSVTLQSDGAANLALEELETLSDKLGLDFEVLSRSYAKFISSTKSSGMDLAEANKIFNAVTLAGSRLKLSTDEISGSLLSVQQMIAGGTVQYDAFQSQIGENIPNALSIAARAMGVNDDKMREMLKNNEVLASELLPKLAVELEKTFGKDAPGEVDSLQGSVNKLKNTFTDLINEKSRISEFFSTVVKGWDTIASSFIDTFNSTSSTEFWDRFLALDGQKSLDRADVLHKLEKVISNTQSALHDVMSKTADKTAGTADEAVQQVAVLNSMLEQNRDAYKRIVKMQKDGTLAKDEFFNTKVVGANIIEIKKYIDLYKKQFPEAFKPAKKAVNELTDAQLTSYEAIRKRIGELSKLPASATEGSEVNRRIEALKARLKELNKTPAKDTELQARNALQKRIDDLHAESVKKQQSSDEQELNSVKLKYEAMRNEVKAFNNDPKNKQKGYRVDGSRLNADEKVETDAVKDKQDTEKLKESLDKQKQLYADYETYKTDLGEDEAKKRFAGELDSNTTYLEALKARRKDILNEQDGNPAEKGRYQLQLKYVGEQIAAEEAANKKKDDAIYANAYKAAMTHAQKMADIEADYQRDVKALGKNATQEQLDNLKRLRDEKIRTENEANLETKIGWKHLFENFDKMSRKEILEKLRKAKKDIQNDVAAGNTTSSQDADKIKQIDEAIAQLDGNASFKNVIDKTNKFFDLFKTKGGKNGETKASFRDMLNGFSDVSGEINSDISKIGEALGAAGIGGEELQNTLKNVMGVVSGAGTLAKGIASGNPVDIVTGSINLLSSAISLFNNKDKKLQKQIDGYKKQLDALQQSYKQLDRAVQNAAGFDIYEKQYEQIANLKAQQAKLIEMRDAEDEKKKKDQGKIDEYNNQIADIPNQIEDVNKAISANLIQGTFRELSNSLADALTSAWQAGEDGLAALDKSFDQFIANAIKNSLKLAFFDKDIKLFTEDLTAYAKENGNSVVGFNFDLWRAKFKVDADNFNAGLEASKEYFKTDESSGDSAVKKDIEGIKSTQASALEGLMRGQYDQLKQQTILLTTSNANWDKWMDIGMQKIAHLEAIEINTYNTVEELKITNRSIVDCNTALTEIVKNTKPGPTIRGAGLG